MSAHQTLSKVATSGNMATFKVTVTQVTIRDTQRFRVNYRKDGVRMRSLFDSKSAAVAEAGRIRADQHRLGDSWLSLPAQDRSKLIEAWTNAKANGVDLSALAQHKPAATSSLSKSLAVVITELEAAKKSAGRDAGYVTSLLVVLNQFAKGRESLAIDLVTLTDVERFMDAKSLQYRSTLRARLSTLFKFAIRRGYLSANPCERLEPVTVTRSAPSVFTPEQAHKARVWLAKNAPDTLTWFLLTTWCGLRPEEAEKTTAKDINFAEGFVRVESATTKTRQGRVVYPKAESMKLLKGSIKKGKLPIDPQRRRRVIRRLRHVLGFAKWPKDITRHSAASYWLADCNNASHVAEMLGNSEKTLKAHYKAVVTRAESARFFNTSPARRLSKSLTPDISPRKQRQQRCR